jgi:hypothetical protein
MASLVLSNRKEDDRSSDESGTESTAYSNARDCSLAEAARGGFGR